MVGTFSQQLACVASEPNGVEHHRFMEPLSWDKRLGLVLPLESTAGQSDQTKHPSKDKDEVGDAMGLDASHQTRIFLRGGENIFFLTSSFIGSLTNFPTNRLLAFGSKLQEHFQSAA
jgi:hypothetical protein